MSKHFLVVLLLASALLAGLYSLPKGVVSNKDKKEAASSRISEQSTATKAASNTHQAPLSAEIQKRIGVAREGFQRATDAKAKSAAAETLVKVYAEATRFDSAAYYAEQLAVLDPSAKSFLRAGDAYYGAFQFAIDEQKTQTMGQKARDFYKKALDENPNLLEAKTNMAMTYVSTDSPMQGIMLLREVLEEAPNFEPALFNIGLLSMQSRQFDKAVERFKKILSLNPKNTKAQFYLGLCYAELGKKTEAKELLEQVQKTEKDPAIQGAITETLEKL